MNKEHWNTSIVNKKENKTERGKQVVAIISFLLYNYERNNIERRQLSCK